LYALHDGDNYPATSTINNINNNIIYRYLVGAGNKTNIDYPLDWDRIHIILNNE
jgi:hypothetical protein